ncbi:YfaZ family outer membrane protein [Ketobacter nezhaii]|uniref:YfaZ family outer membrane protein n=1 Tax=Ketobacter sp. MCCC 1A13808 TaxID=2602738 RepID=UPI0018DD4C0A|nr:YfaZ family outer membrane protein [Ketobacter sp. MCCC 1A13808]
MGISNSITTLITRTSLFCMTCFAVSANAHTLDLSLNNDAVGLDYTTQVSQSEVNVGAGILHHQDNGDAYWGSFFVADNVNKQSGILAGLGGRLYYIDADKQNNSGTALGLGGFVNWDLPNVTNLSLRSDFYYAPDVLAFDEVKRFVDFSARVQYRVIEQAWIYLGYRNAEMKGTSGSDQKIDEGVNVGLMLWF